MTDATTTPLLADRCNAEPVVFRGCSVTELTGLVVGSVLVWLPCGLIIAGVVFGRVTMGLGLGALLALGTSFLATLWFQRMKRGRPEGYYLQVVYCWLADHGVIRDDTVRRTGQWVTGRTMI